MKKWSVKQVRVVVGEPEGEELVIEQSPDGVTCRSETRPASSRGPRKQAAPAKQTKRAESERKAPPERARRPAAAAKPAAPAAKPAAKPAAPAAAAKPAAPKPSDPASTPTAARPGLIWTSIVDNGYFGFAARAPAGQWKALVAKNTQVALFFEWPDRPPMSLGCFARMDKAKDLASDMHRNNWPEAQHGPVTLTHVEAFCPAPEMEVLKEQHGPYTIESDWSSSGITWDDGHVDVYLAKFLEPIGREHITALESSGIPVGDVGPIIEILRTHAYQLGAQPPPGEEAMTQTKAKKPKAREKATPAPAAPAPTDQPPSDEELMESFKAYAEKMLEDGSLTDEEDDDEEDAR